MAARYGHADCVRLLLDSGAEKDTKNNVRVDRWVDVSSFVLFPYFSFILIFLSFCVCEFFRFSFLAEWTHSPDGSRLQ